jgi:DNA processing protein
MKPRDLAGFDLPSGERAARVAWARLVEPEHHAVVERIAGQGAEEALRTLDLSSPLGRQLVPRLELLDVRRDLDIARRTGTRIVVPGDPEWPAGVDDLEWPPLCLWVVGPLDLAEQAARSVAVVGARAATLYGTRQAQDLGAGLAERGVSVVSGAAYGIDGAAHRGALGVEGPTIAFTAGGVDRPYPRGHDGLFAQLRSHGLVVSELPPGCAPTKGRFIARNRLIATVTQGTVVVEAGLRSGSSHTAGKALDHNRVLCAVPGSVESAVSAGCHQLIRNKNAILVTDAAEVMEAVGPIGELAPEKRGEQRPGDGLDPVQGAVYGALPVRRPATVDELAVRAGLDARQVSSALGFLALAGLSRQEPQGWRKAPQPST